MKWPQWFQREPTFVQAMRWTGDNYNELKAWGAPVTFFNGGTDLWLWVEANQGQLRIEEGEWIAKDHLGYYPIKDNGHGRPTNYQPATQDQHA